MNARPLSIAIVAWAVGASGAASQSVAAPGFCTRGAPPPTCRTFLVLETEVGSRSRGGRGDPDLSWHVGILANRGRSALGATAYAAVGLDVRANRPILNTRLGVLPRYRRWLSRSMSLDVSAGPVVEMGRGTPTGLLTTTEVAVGWANDAALSGRVDLGGPNGTAWFAGVRLGSGQVTEALEAQGIGLVVWGIIRFVEAASGN